MSELTLTILQLGFVVLLWLFVFAVVGVLRRDLFGTRITARTGAATSPRPAKGADKTPGRPAATPAPRRGAPRSLVVTEGALRGTTIPLGSAPVLVGRAPECTLVLDDDYASSRHLRLFPRDGDWFVEDLGSTNGTFLGRERLTGVIRIGTGQPVRIGKTVLELRK